MLQILGQRDIAVLKKVVQKVLHSGLDNLTHDLGLEGDYPSSNTYIAMTPTGGIEALTTGTPDEPGSAECDIFQIIDGELHQVDTLTEIVFNFTEAAVPENIYIAIARTKYGNWIVSQEASAMVATHVLAQADGAVAAEDGTYSVDNVTIMLPIGATEYPGGEAPDTANNTHSGILDDDAKVQLTYNQDTETWETTAGDCPA